MARMLLGDQIEIHSDGEDNILPHHACEVVQSRYATGLPVFARHCFHTRRLQVEGEKITNPKKVHSTAPGLIVKGAILQIAPGVSPSASSQQRQLHYAGAAGLLGDG